MTFTLSFLIFLIKMEITLLTDLKKKVFIRTTLLAISSLDEILGLNDHLSADEILLEIFKKSLRDFEQDFPLILEMKVTKEQLCTCNKTMPGFGEFKSNFACYLDGSISEDQIILVPNALPEWRLGGLSYVTSYPVPNAYTAFSEYRRPYVFLEDMPCSDQFIVKGLCSRPIVPDFLPDKTFNPDSKKAAIYWMNVEEGARGDYFMDLVLANVLDFIRQLKSSVQIPGIGVDIFSNVDSAYQEVRSRCDQFKVVSGWYGEMIY
jgi:hypothetical protein